MLDPKNILDYFRLDGKVTLVTGGSRGIGKAIALAMAGAGADVALLGREVSTLNEVAAEIQAMGRKTACVQLDIANVDGIQGAVDQVIAELGSIDILVNNAGLNIRKEVLEYTPDEWDFVMNANLRGAFFLTKACGEHMKERGSGKVLNITSMSAFVGLPTVPAYSASKAALQQLTKLMAVEWAAYGIQSNAIAPGWIATELTKAIQGTPRYDWVISRTPQGRFGLPEDLVGASVFLCSPAADFITGHVIVVDGGLLCGSEWRNGPLGHPQE